MVLESFPKRTFFALLVCLVVLIGSLGAYAYLTYNQSGTSEEADFTFSWGSNRQRIVNRTFRLEVWFTLDGENLTMTIRANDDEYSGADYIGLVFDINQDGRINGSDIPYMLRADNRTQMAYLGENGLLYSLAECPPRTGPQKVTFDRWNGYTLTIQFPWIGGPNFRWNPVSVLKRGRDNLLHICFSDDRKGGVFVRFPFYIPESG